jgi:DNA primase
LLNEKMENIEKIPVSKLAEKLQEAKDIDTVVFDGVITQRLVDIASKKNIKYLVAARVSNAVKQPLNVKIMTFEDIER